MSENWSRLEVEAAVADYITMLEAELRGEQVNKAEHNRQLQAVIQRRSKGSIERKHQNISAIMIEMGYPYISGYKPLRNYQALLGEVVRDRLSAIESRVLDETVQRVVTDPDCTRRTSSGIAAEEVPPPVRESDYNVVKEMPRLIPPGQRRNYLEIEARNHALGSAGEELVLEFEEQRLWTSGRKDLAAKIEHVSNSVGDHLGYDILSFETSGEERLIEVKTTRFGSSTPFFVTSNEISVSRDRAAQYHLYRVFEFARSPRLFRLEGSLEKTCTLTASQFRAMPW